MRFNKIFYFFTLLVGCFLLLVNLYGLRQDIRVDSFDDQYLRFDNDQPANFDDTLFELIRNNGESDLEYATRITHVVARGMSHVEWFDYPAEKFNQLIPIWENYFIHFMGIFSGIPEYERYHFANYQRSLKRGIGVCGDASMVVSQLLDQQDISNRILTFPGHVVVAASFENGKEYIFDGDFGVVVPYSTTEISTKSSQIAQLYLDTGYTQADYNFFNNMYQQKSKQWNGVKHFITNKYYFEKLAYGLKWPVPIFLIIFSVFMMKKRRSK